MSDIPVQAPICDHNWAWVSPAGTQNSARLCWSCHQPDPDWLNTIVEVNPCPVWDALDKDSIRFTRGHNWIPLKGSFLFWRHYRACAGCNYIERVKNNVTS